MSHWLQAWRVPLLLYGCGLLVFGAVAGKRLLHQSPDPHFVYLADAWLDGEIAIDPRPERGDDWAFIDTVELRDGRVVRGRRLTTRPRFRTTGGEELELSQLRRRVERTYYVSFPPAPALLMLPSALVAGRSGNDVIPTVLFAALVLPLAFLTLRRARGDALSRAGDHEPRQDTTSIWLALGFGFGTVFFAIAVQGRVWFTAHVVGTVLTWAYLYCSLGARRPMLAGLCLALAVTSRTPLAFAFPFFAFEAWRAARAQGATEWSKFFKLCSRFSLPIIGIGGLAILYNLARWEAVTEFGHSYLHVRQQANIETHGLLSSHYLGRNLKVAFALLPELSTRFPYVQMSGHGMAVWITTPLLVWVLWVRRRTPLHVPLWITTAAVLAPALLYQNSGWYQFGYRFALDSLPFWFTLIALGPPLRRVGRALVVLGIAINLFGAVTFARDYRFYRVDRDAYRALS